MRVQSVVLRLLLTASPVLAQDSLNVPADTSEPLLVFPQTGFVTIACDSSGLDIFVDGMLVGQAPINEAIPVPMGKHVITYLQPEYLHLLEYYYTGAEFQEFVENAVKTVYVVPNETLNVVLWWQPYEEQIHKRKLVYWVKSIVGVAILTLMLTLNVVG